MIGPRLELRTSQQLVMTPQLVQAIRLLQLSRMELVEEVRKELDGNPVLADEHIEPKERTSADGANPEQASNSEGAAPEAPAPARRRSRPDRARRP